MMLLYFLDMLVYRPREVRIQDKCQTADYQALYQYDQFDRHLPGSRDFCRGKRLSTDQPRSDYPRGAWSQGERSAARIVQMYRPSACLQEEGKHGPDLNFAGFREGVAGPESQFAE
jgi:hypothetical protein